MTIIYKRFDTDYIEDRHGRIYFYRDLYQGNHHEIFKRAEKLIEEGELISDILKKNKEVPFVQTPYIVANISKLIVDVPALLVGRSIGKIDTSLNADSEQIAASNSETDDAIEGTTDSTVNGTILDLQHELIKNIVQNSNLNQEHWGNVVQHQLDGGLVGVPWDDEKGLRIEFKARDVYFPHDDDMGADLSYTRTFGDDPIKYLHVYRERIEETGLRATHKLMRLGSGGLIEGEELPADETAEKLNMKLADLNRFYPGRKRLFIRYWANEKTFMNPLGVSSLKGQEGKQDEINWTLTRTAAVFERNGKPRIAITKELAAALQKSMVKEYGEKARGNFNSKQLEVITMNDKGQSLEIIQIDISKIGDISWVKDLVKMMLMETKTSEKAIDFYMDAGGGGAQSGIAKFYDLFLSLMKAEYIQKEYIDFLKDLIEDALWLQAQLDPAVIIEKPDIAIAEMIPVQRKEAIEENMLAFAGKAQSLETTIRKNNPHASEEWIVEEVARVEAQNISDNSTSLMGGRQTLQEMLDNPNTRPTRTPPAPPVDDPNAANQE